jgi:hypothetical protein
MRPLRDRMNGWQKHPARGMIRRMKVPEQAGDSPDHFLRGARRHHDSAAAASLSAPDRLTPAGLTPHEVAYAVWAIETETAHSLHLTSFPAYGGINFIEMFQYPRRLSANPGPTLFVGARAQAGTDFFGNPMPRLMHEKVILFSKARVLIRLLSAAHDGRALALCRPGRRGWPGAGYAIIRGQPFAPELALTPGRSSRLLGAWGWAGR